MMYSEYSLFLWWLVYFCEESGFRKPRSGRRGLILCTIQTIVTKKALHQLCIRKFVPLKWYVRHICISSGIYYLFKVFDSVSRIFLWEQWTVDICDTLYHLHPYDDPVKIIYGLLLIVHRGTVIRNNAPCRHPKLLYPRGCDKSSSVSSELFDRSLPYFRSHYVYIPRAQVGNCLCVSKNACEMLHVGFRNRRTDQLPKPQVLNVKDIVKGMESELLTT